MARFHWGFHSPNPTRLDFETGAHNVQLVFEAAKLAGLWVVARPGPYIHAETTAGGLPGWVVQAPGIETRTNSTVYTKAWKAYMKAIGAIIAKNQIGAGGTDTVILIQAENEYRISDYYTGAADYMQMIQETYRDAGITVPLFHNDVGAFGFWHPKDYRWMDLYSFDTYPRGFDCSQPELYFDVPLWFRRAFSDVGFDGPMFVAEFQGGAYDSWGSVGYEQCAKMVGPNFADVFYKHALAEGLTMQNLYMEKKTVERRGALTLVSEIKLQGLFKRVSPALLHSGFVEKGTNLSTNSEVFVTRLYNPFSRSGFYITRLDDSNSTAIQSFKLQVSTSVGSIVVPRHAVSSKGDDVSITLDGRQSKIIVADYTAGNTHILYSAAEIMTWTNVDGKDLIVFYTNPGQHIEVSIASSPSADKNNIIRPSGMIVTSEVLGGGEHFLTYTWKQEPGIHHVVSEGAALLFADREAAYKIWAPALVLGPYTRACDTVIVYGPYLVRNATSINSTLALTGDLDIGASPEGTDIEVWANSFFETITWNGRTLRTARTRRGSWTATIKAPVAKFSIPSINSSSTTWKILDSLPEISIDYDDSLWVEANKGISSNLYFPPYTTPVLYAGEYGFHTGNTLYRATFYGNPTFKPIGIKLEVWGGMAFGYTVWFNGQYLGRFDGNRWDENNEQTHFFRENVARDGKNVILVLADRSGYQRDDGGTYRDPHTTLVPRGIRAAILIGVGDNQQTISWTIQGNAGGEDLDDTLRAPYNEDGLYAERIGAHFPDYDDSSWEPGSPMDGFTGPGVKFYRTTLRLDIPDGIDAPLAFWFDIDKALITRVELFVNGYQMGK
ncbi:hypothetical protein FGG08_001302 [Glutinoglossum americanum]|uniref:beta-galactosidase n=1 Tax=Glutinoglossum americanum TaxID=1670608 RepID=A0A9P8L5D7_9PEZI|nr:hypothetical protein FGG08_001302 [Glutinoglossum americanum]